MITFFGTLIRIFFHAFRSKRIILSENALLKKENDILLQRVGKKRVRIRYLRSFVLQCTATASGGFSNGFRSRVNRGRQGVLYARVLSWAGCTITLTDRRCDGWNKSRLRA